MQLDGPTGSYSATIRMRRHCRDSRRSSSVGRSLRVIDPVPFVGPPGEQVEGPTVLNCVQLPRQVASVLAALQNACAPLSAGAPPGLLDLRSAPWPAEEQVETRGWPHSSNQGIGRRQENRSPLDREPPHVRSLYANGGARQWRATRLSAAATTAARSPGRCWPGRRRGRRRRWRSAFRHVYP